MKKIILLIITIFILTGCSAEYELIYENNYFNESLKLTSYKNESFINYVNTNYNRNYFINYKLQLGDMSETEYISKYGGVYNKKIINEENNYGIELGYNYDKKEEYINSSIVYNLFDNIYVNENIIRATNIKNIFESYDSLKEIKIVFSTDKNVISTNCDEEKDGKYYWYINNNNYKQKDIKIDLDENENKLLTSDGYLNGKIIKYILMFILIIVLISIPIIYEKVRKSNI